jgi:hypothetical protein
MSKEAAVEFETALLHCNVVRLEESKPSLQKLADRQTRRGPWWSTGSEFRFMLLLIAQRGVHGTGTG